VCSKAEQEILDRGSKKSDRLHDYLMKQTPSLTTESVSTDDESLDAGLRKALEHKDRLLEYDKTRYTHTVQLLFKPGLASLPLDSHTRRFEARSF